MVNREKLSMVLSMHFGRVPFGPVLTIAGGGGVRPRTSLTLYLSLPWRRQLHGKDAYIMVSYERNVAVDKNTLCGTRHSTEVEAPRSDAGRRSMGIQARVG